MSNSILTICPSRIVCVAGRVTGLFSSVTTPDQARSARFFSKEKWHNFGLLMPFESPFFLSASLFATVY